MQYGEIITFGPRGTAKDFNPVGFDFGDAGGVSWTAQQNCQLEVALPMPRQDVFLEIEVIPFISADKVMAQQLFIYVNGLFQAFHTFRVQETRIFPIAKIAISSRSTLVSFVIPTAVSPKSIGLSPDIRELGLAFTSMSFTSK